MHTYYEFFAGAGMARAGLGASWRCLFANDNSSIKRDCYIDTWKDKDHFTFGDVNKLSVDQLIGQADLAWASFPCQDLSLAGKAAGIGTALDNEQTRSGAFWGFWNLIKTLEQDGRHPNTIVLENVCGFLSSNGGHDFRIMGNALASLGYFFGALVVDAIHFLPQSRPRVFVIATRSKKHINQYVQHEPDGLWHTDAVVSAHDRLSRAAKETWIWWNLAPPKLTKRLTLEEIVTDHPKGVSWHSQSETDKLVQMMSAKNRAKLETLKLAETRKVATIYKRTRRGNQMAELRDDGVAGCLRTPGGGSSRQIVMIIEGASVRSRLLSPEEAMALMGASDLFVLPSRYNDAYYIAGDGVAVPVVRHLAHNLIEPIVDAQRGNAFSFESDRREVEFSG